MTYLKEPPKDWSLFIAHDYMVKTDGTMLLANRKLARVRAPCVRAEVCEKIIGWVEGKSPTTEVAISSLDWLSNRYQRFNVYWPETDQRRRVANHTHGAVLGEVFDVRKIVAGIHLNRTTAVLQLSLVDVDQSSRKILRIHNTTNKSTTIIAPVVFPVQNPPVIVAT